MAASNLEETLPCKPDHKKFLADSIETEGDLTLLGCICRKSCDEQGSWNPSDDGTYVKLKEPVIYKTWAGEEKYEKVPMCKKYARTADGKIEERAK